MPLARITVPAHLPEHQAIRLADAVHFGLVHTCNVPDEDRFQLVLRLPAGAMLLHPTFGGVSRSADASVVEISFLQGRSDEQKRALYRSVVQQAESAGFRPDDVLIALTENAPIDWSLGRGQAYAG